MCNRLFIIVVSVLLGGLLLNGCDSQVSRFKEKVAELQSRPLSLPLDSMRYIQSHVPSSFMPKGRVTEIKLVVYTDSADCSSCVLKKMYKWNGLLRRMRMYGRRIQSYFIFRPSPKNMGDFNLSMKQFAPLCPVYLDSLGVFERANSQIPSDPVLHTFLLDEDNNVLLVGNPIWNEKIKELFWQIVEEKLGKRE